MQAVAQMKAVVFCTLVVALHGAVFSNLTLPNMRSGFGTTGYLDQEEFTSGQPAYLVLGITGQCLVYLQWLNRFTLSQSKYQEEIFYVKEEEKPCADILPFFTQTEVTKTDLLIGVWRFGRRLVIQSLVNSACLSKKALTKKFRPELQTFTCKINPRARHFQFLTQEFPAGFTYINTLNLFNRLIVYGYTADRIMLLMLKIGQSNADFGPGGHDSILAPHLQLLATVNSSIIEPSGDVVLMEPNKMDQNPADLFFYLGHRDPKQPAYLDAVKISLAGAMHGRLDYISKIERIYGTFYADEFITAPYTFHENYGNMAIKRVDRHWTRSWTGFDLPPIESLLLGDTGKTWMNPYRFHRRMAYPHAIHRVKRTRVLDGWKVFIPIVIANLLVFILLMSISTWFISHHQELLRRIGVMSASRSSLTR